MVALLTSGRPLTLPWLFEQASAVLATWFLGAEAGTAIADVLTGRFNPVGRLPVTWPRAVGQIPIFYAARPSGRPFDPADHYTSKYLDISNAPQFHFGHGLSYCHFAISVFSALSRDFRLGDVIRFSVEVVNEGPMQGEATVFLFARDVVASIARPVLELKRFAKIALGPGETDVIDFVLPAAELSFPGADFRPCFEAGRIRIFGWLQRRPGGADDDPAAGPPGGLSPPRIPAAGRALGGPMDN